MHIHIYIYIYIYTYIYIFFNKASASECSPNSALVLGASPDLRVRDRKMALDRGAHRPRHSFVVRLMLEIVWFYH